MNRIQNHKDGGIASVYDRHSYAHEARVIQEAVADQIEATDTTIGRTRCGNAVEESRVPEGVL
jgi:hypothetical protein